MEKVGQMGQMGKWESSWKQSSFPGMIPVKNERENAERGVLKKKLKKYRAVPSAEESDLC